MKSLLAKISIYLRLGFAMALMVMRSRELRRKLMFWVSIAAMFAVFLGGVVFIDFLTEHPWIFIAYWLLTGTLVLGMILLALYDMLRLKADQTVTERAELMDLLAEIEKAAVEEAGSRGEKEGRTQTDAED